jgi:hypothetical protein
MSGTRTKLSCGLETEKPVQRFTLPQRIDISWTATWNNLSRYTATCHKTFLYSCALGWQRSCCYSARTPSGKVRICMVTLLAALRLRGPNCSPSNQCANSCSCSLGALKISCRSAAFLPHSQRDLAIVVLAAARAQLTHPLQ